MNGILVLFEEPASEFARNTEAYYNPKIEKIMVAINSKQNQLYDHGMRSHHVWGETKKFFAAGHKRQPEVAVVAKDLDLSDVSLGEFLTTKFDLWLGLRTSDDEQLHGNGRNLAGGSNNMIIEILRKPEASGVLIVHVYYIQDAQINIQSGKLASLVH